MANENEEKRKLDEMAKKQEQDRVLREKRLIEEQIKNREQELKSLRDKVTGDIKMLDTLKLQVKNSEQELSKVKTEVSTKEREINDLRRKKDTIR